LSGAKIGRMGPRARIRNFSDGSTGRLEHQRAVLADPFYYLENFQSALSLLERRYGDLLSSEELQFIGQFAELPRPSRALLVRMIMRNGALFRLSRLRYPEIGDTAEAAAPLIGAGWLEHPRLDVRQLHRLLTKEELVRCLRLPKALCRLDKSTLLQALVEHHLESRPFEEWCKDTRDRVYRPIVKSLAERLRLMFFGNFHQGWSEFVLAELGIYRYETVRLQSAPFRRRGHIEALQQLHQCHRDLEEGAGPVEVMTAMPPPIADCEWLEDIRQRLLFQIACVCEKRRDDAPAALAMLLTCRHRGARARAIRLMERLGQWQAARDLCCVARESPESESERQRLRRVLPRLNRKLGIVGDGTGEPPAVATFEVSLEPPQSDRRIELTVRDLLARREAASSSVHYVENGLINSLFGLLFWDAIFAPIPGAFFHDFQSGPADLESDRFLERRRNQFAQRFADLESGDYRSTIRRRFVAKAGIQSPFVAWGLLTRRLLELALRCFPASHLRLYFDWIARDVVDNRAGFPDLIQFWPDQARYRMVEVKGPGDRLQDNQRRLFEFCARHDMPVFVCQVRIASQYALRLPP